MLRRAAANSLAQGTIFRVSLSHADSVAFSVPPTYTLRSGWPKNDDVGLAKLIAAQALVHAESLELTYAPGVRALDGLDLGISAGQFVSIVGPSGCGKSTLLRLIAGLVTPTRGSLTVGGLEPRVARSASHLSFVFQDPTLLPWRTVRDNVRLPLELAGGPRAETRHLAEQVLATVGLSDFAGNYPNELSGGMRMRVSLARALVTEPELLLLDEPFAALDDITRQTLNDELMRLWSARRWTGIFVTHNIGEAVFLSQRVLVMSARPGQIVADIEVPLPLPRVPEIRSSGQYAELTGTVGDILRRGRR